MPDFDSPTRSRSREKENMDRGTPSVLDMAQVPRRTGSERPNLGIRDKRLQEDGDNSCMKSMMKMMMQQQQQNMVVMNTMMETMKVIAAKSGLPTEESGVGEEG